RTLRHLTGFAATLLRAGLLGHLSTGFNILLRYFFSHRLQVCVGVQHGFRVGTGADRHRRTKGPGHLSFHALTIPFWARHTMTCAADIPHRRTRFCRPPAPDSIRTAVVGRDNSLARKWTSSLFAAPSTGGAAIRILRALP